MFSKCVVGSFGLNLIGWIRSNGGLIASVFDPANAGSAPLAAPRFSSVDALIIELSFCSRTST